MTPTLERQRGVPQACDRATFGGGLSTTAPYGLVLIYCRVDDPTYWALDYFHGVPAFRRFSRLLMSAEMHQTDLTKRRMEFSVPVPNLLAIGWIEPDQFYHQGESSAEFIIKLRRILETESPTFDLRVNATRGAYYCKFCNPGQLLCDRDEECLVNSYCDYWIPDGEVWFVTPGLILHYIEEHNYSPPPQFINAVMKLDTNTIVLAERAQNEIWNSYWNRLAATE